MFNFKEQIIEVSAEYSEHSGSKVICHAMNLQNKAVSSYYIIGACLFFFVGQSLSSLVNFTHMHEKKHTAYSLWLSGFWIENRKGL